MEIRLQILIFPIMFMVIGVLVHWLCRWLKLKPVYPVIARPKRSALCALASVSASVLIIYLPMLIALKLGPTQGAGPSVAHEHHRNLVNQLVVLFVYFLPMALMLRLNGETLQSVGFTRANLWKAAVVGLFLIPTTIFNSDSGPGAVFKFTEGHNMISLIYFSFVGFGEEIFYRGYLQSRLVAWLGRYRGWILASVIFALIHLPGHMLLQGIGFPAAIVSQLVYISVSLLFGYIMLKTGSVVPGSLFHTFLDWVANR